MASDRRFALTVRTAARSSAGLGVVEHPVGRWEGLKRAWLIGETEREDLLRTLEFRQHHLTTLLPLVGEESRPKLAEQLDHLLELHSQLLYPWHKSASGRSGRASQDEIDRMKATWAAEYGDPDSPETQARIQAALAAIQKARQPRPAAPPRRRRRRRTPEGK